MMHFSVVLDMSNKSHDENNNQKNSDRMEFESEILEQKKIRKNTRNKKRDYEMILYVSVFLKTKFRKFKSIYC